MTKRILIILLLVLMLPVKTQAKENPLQEQVTVVYHGNLMRTRVREETVGDLLQRLNLPVQENDVLSHGTAEKIQGGMTLRVDSVIIQEELYTTTIPYEVSSCNDATLPEGTWEVLIPGVDGELSCRAEVTYINGKETSRNILSQTQTIAPVTEVVAWGTGAVPVQAPVDPKGIPIIEDGYIHLPTGEVLTYTKTGTVRASAYTHTDEGCDFITSTGSRVHVGTVAVDPRYIPYGTRMFIMARSGSYVYGISEAEDCGGAIKGDRVDLYLPTYEECMEFGRRVCTVYYLG